MKFSLVSMVLLVGTVGCMPSKILDPDGTIVELAGEKEMPDLELEDLYEEDFSNLEIPPSLNWKHQGLMANAVNQGSCRVCGYISGTQALESRAGIATGIYQEWSIQNILNCVNTKKGICSGAQPTRVGNVFSLHPEYLIPETASPFVKKNCGECECITGTDSSLHAQLRDLQWFYIGPSLRANTVEKALGALQSGPLVTCFARDFAKTRASPDPTNGNDCHGGCRHANSIIGYDVDRWYLQESFGEEWSYPRKNESDDELRLNDGTWYANRGSECEGAILKKARYTKVFYDYDRGNAYFTPEEVAESRLQFVDRDSQEDVQDEDYSSIGMAKRRCSLMGVKCGGVVKLSSGEVQLVKGTTPSPLSSSTSLVTLHRKTQMVIYLRHEATGLYLTIKEKQKGLKLVLGRKSAAMPFFTSLNRFISYHYPDHLISGNVLRKFLGTTETSFYDNWALRDAILMNTKSGKSMDVNEKGYITGTPFKRASPTQRFNIGISGMWRPTMTSTGAKYSTVKNIPPKFYLGAKGNNRDPAYLRWQARQVVSNRGKPFTPDWSPAPGYFRLGDTDNEVEVRDAQLVMLASLQIGMPEFLSADGKQLEMVTESGGNTRWSFEYDDLTSN